MQIEFKPHDIPSIIESLKKDRLFQPYVDKSCYQMLVPREQLAVLLAVRISMPSHDYYLHP